MKLKFYRVGSRKPGNGYGFNLRIHYIFIKVSKALSDPRG